MGRTVSPNLDPDLFSTTYIDQTAQFYIEVGYLFERGKKRSVSCPRCNAVTESLVVDAERALTRNVTQVFAFAVLSKANLLFATRLVDSFPLAVAISDEPCKAGAMSKADHFKIRLQTLRFWTC